MIAGETGEITTTKNSRAEIVGDLNLYYVYVHCAGTKKWGGINLNVKRIIKSGPTLAPSSVDGGEPKQKHKEVCFKTILFFNIKKIYVI